MGDVRFGVVLLAAGGGQRMGGAKLTLPWGPAGTVAGAALQAALAAPVAVVVAVTGAGAPAVRQALEAAAAGPVVTAPGAAAATPEAVRQALEAAEAAPRPVPAPTPETAATTPDSAPRPELRIVHNPRWPEGMATSLQAGLAALPPGLSGFFVALADMPLVSPATYRALLAAFVESPGIWLPTYQGRRGHPVLFPMGFAAAAAGQRGDVGMRRVLAEYAHQVRELPVTEPGVVIDLDTPAEYARYAPPGTREGRG